MYNAYGAISVLTVNQAIFSFRDALFWIKQPVPECPILAPETPCSFQISGLKKNFTTAHLPSWCGMSAPPPPPPPHHHFWVGSSRPPREVDNDGHTSLICIHFPFSSHKLLVNLYISIHIRPFGFFQPQSEAQDIINTDQIDFYVRSRDLRSWWYLRSLPVHPCVASGESSAGSSSWTSRCRSYIRRSCPPASPPGELVPVSLGSHLQREQSKTTHHNQKKKSIVDCWCCFHTRHLLPGIGSSKFWLPPATRQVKHMQTLKSNRNQCRLLVLLLH